MIAQIFPNAFQRYLSLPVLGPLMDPYAAWLHDQHYTWRSSRYELRMAAHVSTYLKRRAIRQIEDVTDQHLAACHRMFRRRCPEESGSVHVLARFLYESGCVERSAPLPSGPVDIHAGAS